MDLRILVLDDNLTSVLPQLEGALKPFLGDRNVPEALGGSQPWSIVLTGLSAKPVELEVLSNSYDDVTAVKREEIESGVFDKEIDLVLLDDDWGSGGAHAGQDQLLEPVFRLIHGRAAGSPVICLWTQYWAAEETRTDRYTELLRQPPYWGSNRVTGCDKSDVASLRLLVQRVVAERELYHKLRLAQEVAHADSELLKYTRDFIGIDSVLLETADHVQPFVDWQAGKYDSAPDPWEFVELEFVSCLLFEGPPGTGKSTLCEAIAKALQSKMQLFPRDLAPKKTAGEWKEPLEENMRKFHAQALSQRGVTVIWVDDRTWPDISQIQDAALREDWQNYMRVLREYLAVATRINKGEAITQQDKIGWTGVAKGKILWLFAHNTPIEVGEMSSFFEDYMLKIEVAFPTDPVARRLLLEHAAQKKGLQFDPSALALAVDALGHCRVRDLIGDKNAPRGFMLFVSRRVRAREKLRWQQNPRGYHPDRTIGVDIVQAWLRSPQYSAILNRGDRPIGNDLPSAVPPVPRPQNPGLTEDEERVVAKLNQYETGFEKARQHFEHAPQDFLSGRIRLEDIAAHSEPRTSHVPLSNLFNSKKSRKRVNTIHALGKRFGEWWPLLKTLDQWPPQPLP